MSWITQAPAQLKEAKALLSSPSEDITWEAFDTNYWGSAQEKTIYRIPQCWILIESQHALKRELNTFQYQLDKKAQTLTKILWHLDNQVFQCLDDAEQAVQSPLTSLRYHQIHYDILLIERYSGKGRPKPDAQKIVIGYQIHAVHSTCLNSIRAKKETLGRFILATNQVDKTLLTAHSLLKQYKEQAFVESSFKLIKNNTFELDSVFLKTPAQISALMTVMTLCLIVYNFAQSHLRKCLEEQNEMLPNQLGKPVKNPTLKWIAELMNSIYSRGYPCF